MKHGHVARVDATSLSATWSRRRCALKQATRPAHRPNCAVIPAQGCARRPMCESQRVTLRRFFSNETGGLSVTRRRWAFDRDAAFAVTALVRGPDSAACLAAHGGRPRSRPPRHFSEVGQAHAKTLGKSRLRPVSDLFSHEARNLPALCEHRMATVPENRPMPERDHERLPHLRAWRRHLAFSQREVARGAALDPATVRRLEEGRPARPRTVRMVAQALGLSPAELRRPPASNS
jgi:Helix-turn-helix domain